MHVRSQWAAFALSLFSDVSAAQRKTAELAGECVKWKNKFTAASSDCQKEKQVCVHTETLRESGTDGPTGTHTKTAGQMEQQVHTLRQSGTDGTTGMHSETDKVR